MEVKIKNNNEMIDATIEMVDGVMVVSPKEVKFKPKDGEVVYVGGFYDFVFIYKDNLTAEAYYYVALFLRTNKIELPDGGHIGYVSELRPVTEEEKKLLFDKLAEEGLEWNPDTKELVKIKWKPYEGEICFAPYFDFPKFITKQWLWEINGFSTDYYNKNWIFRSEQECQEFCNRLNEAINQVKP